MGYPTDLQDIPGASYGSIRCQNDLEMNSSTSTEAGKNNWDGVLRGQKGAKMTGGSDHNTMIT